MACEGCGDVRFSDYNCPYCAKRKAKAEASVQNFKKTFANALKQEEIKRQLVADAHAATQDPNRRAPSGDIQQLREMHSFHGYRGKEIITGMEPRPWEDND